MEHRCQSEAPKVALVISVADTSSLGSDGSIPVGAVRMEGFSTQSTLPRVPEVSDDTRDPWGTEPIDSR